ncbi:HAD family hydrolase [Mesorhizobium sp. YM1C-6-2]|uniref:HAD family hydrolase n=1 Tax=Mesorhizobium sp. YM1C-6-2 TaxID=1827501 RepID=UPI000EF23438|nr:HAD family hydrolase [Mesorhizobium sp. YM1C-6-2]RLP25499.1 HAD family hydrolase [Mesorhizobium sp. YM1C-6-2]
MPAAPRLTTIGFDADDTLWQNEQFYQTTQAHFIELLKDYADPEQLPDRLLKVMLRNIGAYGFGIKSFTLSMVETAIEVTEGRAPAQVIQEILAAGREMARHPVETLPFARETLEALAGRYRLVLITKGDLFDQERKIAESGLGELFEAVEIVSDKNRSTYQRVFDRHGDGPHRSLMVGNSLKSDILPAIAAGSWGIFVPHDLTWAYEHAEAPQGEARFRQAAHLGEIAGLIEEIERG